MEAIARERAFGNGARDLSDALKKVPQIGVTRPQRIAWPSPRRLPSLSRNHAAFSPTPPRLG